MINIEEIISNIDNLDIINPFTFKYTTPSFIEFSVLEFNIYEYYYFSISIFNYLQILKKIFNNNNSKFCFLCKEKNSSNFCCNLCHEWFCNSCSKLHSEEDPIHNENIKKNILKLYNKQYKNFSNDLNIKMKFSSLNKKNWKICECEYEGGEFIYYCKHGLKCKNCFNRKLCPYCDNDYIADNFRFFHLDLVFLETEIKYYKIEDEIEEIKNYIKNFNKNIAKLYLDNLNKIEEKPRKKRFTKHFYKERNNFIAYFKLKLIIINILKKNRNFHLIKLFKIQNNFKLIFKKYKYFKNINENENISKISNFFATKKPIFFVEKKLKKNPLLIKQYLKKNKLKQNKNKNINNLKQINTLQNGFFSFYYEEENKFNNYAINRNLFHFYKEDELTEEDIFNNYINKKSIYSIEFTGKNDNISLKRDLFFSGVIYSTPINKLINGKWVFQITNLCSYSPQKNWICFLNENKFKLNIFRLEHIIYCEQLDLIFHITKKNKYLLYNKSEDHKNNKIAILDLFFPYKMNFNILPIIELDKFFELKNYENIILISCLRPYLNLIIFDYELNQVNSIIELINPFVPNENFYKFIPYIDDIEELKNNKLLLYGNQKYEKSYPPFPPNKYKFKIVFDLINFRIDLAENEAKYDYYLFNL